MNTDPQHLISLFENATEGIILTDGLGNIMLVNPAAERLFGYLSTQLVGQPIEILIPDKYRHHHHELREGFYEHPSNRVMGHNRDLYGRRKDGIEIPLEVSLSHYRQGEQLFVIAFIVDIARRKEIEDSMLRQQKELQKISSEIRKLNAELERKVEERTVILKEALQRLEDSQMELSEALNKEKMLNEIKGRFVSMASHEFRTPLSTVLSSASLLSRYTTTDEQDKRNRHIEKIKNSVKHLNDILEDFLSLGKLDEGKVSIHTGEFDLQEFVIDVVDEMKGFTKKEQSIDYAHQGEALVFSDKKLLKNILINLIGNAIKFSNEGCSIIIRSSTNGDLAVISIADQGIGISKDDLEHLFSSFFRAANAINIQGTGLGLHIVKRYVDLLNGQVKVESELNKGTTITITIPIIKEEI
ncbi:MAG: PAS domain-containing sensor histidine kinase [Chitinophagaceae bacterium]|nr:PAS domain-containing sensor histidine kinase [Chitinophagaceae bacterium]